jgi:CBS domain-containing protein
MLMPTLDRYMTREPYAIGSSESLARARELMTAHAIRHLPVVDGARLVGQLAERDLAVVGAIPGVDLHHVEVGRVMAPALTAWSEDPLDEVAAKMSEHRRDCVVVRGGEGIAGVFTATDALRALAEIARRACG